MTEAPVDSSLMEVAVGTETISPVKPSVWLHVLVEVVEEVVVVEEGLDLPKQEPPVTSHPSYLVLARPASGGGAMCGRHSHANHSPTLGVGRTGWLTGSTVWGTVAGLVGWGDDNIQGVQQSCFHFCFFLFFLGVYVFHLGQPFM